MTFNYVSHSKLHYTVNKLLALTNAGGGSSGSGISQSDLDAKEDALEISTLSGTSVTLTAEVGKFYRGGNITNMTVTLPTMSTSVTKPQGLILYFYAGTSASITIRSASNQNIMYFSDFAIKTGKYNEINCMWVGNMWVIAYGTIE